MPPTVAGPSALGHSQALTSRTQRVQLRPHVLRPTAWPVVCALSLQPRASSTEAGPSGVRVVESAQGDEMQRAYEAGYQAGLAAAARSAQQEAGETTSSGTVSDVEPVVLVQQDSLMRSLVKSSSWRIFSTATTIILTMTIFESTLDEALELGAAEFVSKYLLYFIHERVWIAITLF